MFANVSLVERRDADMFMRELASNMDMFMFDPEDVIRLMDAPTLKNNFYRASLPKIESWRERMRKSRDPFYGNLDLDECRAALYGEYKYGAKRLDERIAWMVVNKRKLRHPVSSVTGCCPNVGAYLSGRPNSMWNAERKEVPSKAMRILLFGDWNRKDSGETVMRACDRIAPCIVGLELDGTQCEVFMASACEFLYCGAKRNKDKVSIFNLFKVKSFGQRMNAGRTAFMCGSPSFFRRVKFNLFFSFDGYAAKGGKFSSGFGYPITESELSGFFRMEDVPELKGARTVNLRELAYKTDKEYPSYITSCLCG